MMPTIQVPHRSMHAPGGDTSRAPAPEMNHRPTHVEGLYDWTPRQFIGTAASPRPRSGAVSRRALSVGLVRQLLKYSLSAVMASSPVIRGPSPSDWGGAGTTWVVRSSRSRAADDPNASISTCRHAAATDSWVAPAVPNAKPNTSKRCGGHRQFAGQSEVASSTQNANWLSSLRCQAPCSEWSRVMGAAASMEMGIKTMHAAQFCPAARRLASGPNSDTPTPATWTNEPPEGAAVVFPGIHRHVRGTGRQMGRRPRWGR